MKLILASNSPRRKEILEKFGYRFTVIKSDYEEKEDIFDPRLLVKTFAEKKAESVFSSLSEAEKDEAVVLGADTVVVLKGKILGKPKDDRDAVNMLKSLSGRTHLVLTGYAVITGGKTFSGVAETKVVFNTLTDKFITDYVATGSPLDKAGAYGIQDGALVKKYVGSFYNVIGLPIEEIAPILERLL